MQVYEKIAHLQPLLTQKKLEGSSVGFVPTMGALHKGHFSLIEKALQENDLVVVSIFVNPTQFNDAKDFDAYPRVMKSDLDLLSEFGGNVFVYIPEVKDIYPNGIESVTFDFGGIENEMEGKFRKGHFDGVGMVLKSLFNNIMPNRAYFGEKDFQQLQIVKKLVELENLPVAIIGCPIFREPSGLAMSSRNKRLNKTQLAASSLVFSLLTRIRNDFGTVSVESLTNWVENEIENSEYLELEYFQIADETTLKPLKNIEKGKAYRAFIAVYAGDVRLIDNIALN